jgi:hypothetical protein
MGHLLRSLSEEEMRQSWGTTETAALIRIGIVVILAVLVIGRLVDWRRGRAEEAMGLQARLSDALMVDPAAGDTTATVVARVPMWPGAPLTLEVRGSVRTPEARDAAIRTALRVLADQPGRVSLEDRLWVDPAPLRQAA